MGDGKNARGETADVRYRASDVTRCAPLVVCRRPSPVPRPPSPPVNASPRPRVPSIDERGGASVRGRRFVPIRSPARKFSLVPEGVSPPKLMSVRRIPLLAVASAIAALAACENKKAEQAPLPTTAVTRGNINVRVQATGTVEPINPVDIKSKAQGQIIALPVEVGSVVKRGQEIAKIDPRDVKNQYDQAVADDVVSYTSLQATKRDQARQDSLFAAHVITASEHDSSKATLTAAQADLVNSRAALDLRRQALEDAPVEAPLGGTVVSRPTTQGTIITSATSANGGTTLMTIADLGRVRMRVTIDEV